ncbi:hypothetical protein SLS55_005469 [Diplodia seriata]|uniref:Amino acid permease/ SLC12A domain-containing protein n=1 Tax=Diplodia seriata TaxID=420778 RepID=A0ABR3CGQ9_9PEZI
MASKTDNLKEKVFEPSPFGNTTSSDSDSAPDIGSVQNVNTLHRSLDNRQIQWIAMGGSIGTALFVSIGLGLMNGGPASLLLGFIFYSCGKWVDEAFGFVAGWNLFLYEAILVPFEISALSLVLTFWRDDIPVWAVCIVCIALYTAINIGAVHVFGEAEFWLSSGKVLLVFLLFGFTVVTMVGGNPKGDSYGFRYWNNPGAFAEHITTGALGKFEGFLGAVFVAAFTVCGPEYISMVAGEAIYPRVTIKLAFKTVYLRFGCFFILGAFCVGVVLPYNDQTLANVLGSQGGSTGAASPYVIAMQNLGIDGLPHVVNALLVTSIFSAGNTYYYMATRSLYSLAVNKQAPAFFSKTTKSGAPIWCFAATMAFSFLSLLQLGAGSAQALQWLVNLVTASQQLNYAIIEPCPIKVGANLMSIASA